MQKLLSFGHSECNRANITLFLGKGAGVRSLEQAVQYSFPVLTYLYTGNKCNVMIPDT